MSKQVDERVVSMQFDNKHFEKNVSTTMSTLDKLKQSLKLTGASKGLENMQSAANKIDFSKMEGTVCKAGFHIEDVWQKLSTVFEYQIARRIVNAASNIANALTIAPITTGFNEYELKMNSVQTIMASTGESIDTVNKYLEELNKYSDQTIYSFSDMTQNIGKFTNAGVKLEDAVMAIKGISNEAAVSGANANEASRAMYNFSQALSAGYVKLIDWKSIENANMATVEFKEQLIETALALGTITKASDGMYKTLEGNAFSATKNFNEVFQDEWMTSEVLIETLKKYAGETTEIGKKAKAAATEVKTISQLYDTLKESAQSGWAQTWELLVGDLVEAKDILTKISKVVGGFIDKMSSARNSLLGGALTSKWEKLTEVIGEAGLKMDDYEASIKEVYGNDTEFDKLIEKYGSLRKAVEAGEFSADILRKALRKLLGMQDDLTVSTDKMGRSMEDYNKVVNEVIRGEWGSGEKRWKKLAEAGYDWAKVQNMVNEHLKSSVRHLETLSEEQIANANALGAYTEEQLKSMGYTEEQIIALKDLNRAAQTTGDTVDELFADMDKKSGRQLLIESFQHIFEEIGKLFKAFGDAWSNVFEPIDSDNLYDVIAAFHELVTSMTISETTADNFRRILEGIFSAFDLTWSVASMSFMGALKILNEILKLFGTDIMGAAAKLADYITKFNEWVEGQAFFGAATKWSDIAKVIVEILTGVIDCFKALFKLEKLQGVIEKIRLKLKEFFGTFGDFSDGFTVENVVKAIRGFFDKIESWITNLDNVENLGKYIIDGLIKGITVGIPKVIGSIFELAWGMIKAFCEVWIIHSPARKAIELIGYVITGFINGIVEGAKKVFSAMRDFGKGLVESYQNSGVSDFFGKIGNFFINLFTNIANFLSSVDWGAVVAAGLSIGFILAIKAVADALKMLATPLMSINKVMTAVSGAFDKVGDFFKAKAFREKAIAVREIATAVFILAAGIFLLASIESGPKLAQAVIAIGILIVAMSVLLIAVNKMSNTAAEFEKGSVKLQGMNTGLIGIAAALIAVITAVAIFGNMSTDQMTRGFAAVTAAMVLLLGFIAATTGLSKWGKDGKNIGGNLLKIAVAMGILVIVMKMLKNMEWADMGKAFVAMTGLTGILALLMLVTKIGNYKKVASMLIQMAGVMAILAVVMKLIGTMKWGDIGKATVGMLGLVGIMSLMMLITKIGTTKKIAEISGIIGALGGAILAMAVAAKLLATMTWADMGKAAVGLVGLSGVVALLVAISNIVPTYQVAKIGGTLLALSSAIAVLAVVAILLSMVKPEGLVKGIIAVGALAGIMALLVTSLRGAADVQKSLIVLAITIGALAGIIALLCIIPDSGKVVQVAASLAIVIIALSLAIRSMKELAYINFGEVIVGMLGIALAVGVLATILAILSTMDIQGAIPNAIGLGVLLLALTYSLSALDKVKVDIAKSAEIMVSLAMMFIPLAAFAAVLAGMSGVTNAIPNAIALGVLIAACSYFLPTIASAGKLAKEAALGALVLAEMSLALAGFAFILASMSNTQNAIPNAIALGVLVAICANMLPLITRAGHIAGQAALGVLVLLETALPLAAFAFVLASMSQVKNAIPNAIALGILVAAAVAIVWVLSLIPLPALGAAAVGVLVLLELAIPLLAFVGVLALMSDVKNAIPNAIALSILVLACSASLVVLAAVGLLAATALLGVAALVDLVSQMTVFVDLLSIMEGLQNAEQNAAIITSLLTTFTGCLVALALVAPLALIGVGAVDYLINVIKSLVIFATIVAGLMEVIPGLRDLMDNGLDLIEEVVLTLGDIIVAFVNGFQDIPTEVVQNVKTLVDALMILTAATLLGQLSALGALGVAIFAGELLHLGKAMVDFSDIVSGNIDMEAVESAHAAAMMMSELANSLPMQWGGLQYLIGGQMSLKTFSEQLVLFGEALDSFANEINDKDINETAVQNAKNCADIMVALANNLPQDWGFVNLFAGGQMNLATFGNNLRSFGASMAAFAQSINDDNINTEAVAKAKACADMMVTLSKSLPKIGGVNSWFDGDASLGKFGENLKTFGGHLKGYAGMLNEINFGRIGSTTTHVENLIKMAKNASGVDFGGLNNFGSALKSMASSGIKDFIQAFESSATKITELGSQLVMCVISGMNKQKNTFIDGAKKLADSVVSGLSDKASAFTTAGEDLGDGLVVGINNKVDDAYNAGYALGQAAVQGEKDGQQSKSPSKLTEKAGVWLGEGLIVGMKTMTSRVYTSGRDLGDLAANTLSNTIAKISESINSDIDSQPTIRPVLDLSDVTAGAGAINGLFNNPTVGVMSNVRSINSMMNSQNRGNGDIISALSDLKNTLNNKPSGNTYNLNGLSYSEGDDVAQAFETIIRAARVERRA